MNEPHNLATRICAQVSLGPTELYGSSNQQEATAYTPASLMPPLIIPGLAVVSRHEK